MARGTLRKRSVRIKKHRTSIALEPVYWTWFEQIVKLRGTTIPKLLAEIDAQRTAAGDGASLASAVRVFILLNRP